MKGDDNPDVTRAKMVALLSLLDVLSSRAEMSAVAIDRVGQQSAYAGKVRLKFTVFGQESRLLELATELTSRESGNDLMALLKGAVGIEDKIAFAMDRIDAWTEVVRRLLSAARLDPTDRALPSGQRSLPPSRGRLVAEVGPPTRTCHPGDRCPMWPDCESCGPPRQ